MICNDVDEGTQRCGRAAPFVVFGLRVPLALVVCAACSESAAPGGASLIAFLEEPTVVKGILTHLGLPAEPLPARNAQAPPTTVEMFEDP